MEVYEDRIVNGLLKAGLPANTPGDVERLLDVDVHIVAPESRAVAGDLWPCIWALAAVASRQFLGNIVIRCGLKEPLASPAPLDPRCHFDPHARLASRPIVTIGLGRPAAADGIWGDARALELAIGTACNGRENAHPIAAFALAGYLGFAALAVRAGIPGFREDLCASTLRFGTATRASLPADGLALLGLGQLGQAYLALLYFLQEHLAGSVRLALLDKDAVGPENAATQLFCDHAATGFSKAEILAAKLRPFGWNVEAQQAEMTWEWRRPPSDPRVALLGFDNVDARRMALIAGYDWLVEAGLRDSFTEPLVTWHSVPGGRAFSGLFPRSTRPRAEVAPVGAFFDELQRTPGKCGWLTFASVTASAPSMGLVASAYVWAELLAHLSGSRAPVRGCARLWSPLLPYERRELSPGSVP